MRFDKGENKKSCATRHIARCQGTVKLDTKCHALRITKSPYSNCSRIGMMKSNTTNKKPPRVLHPSIKTWIQLTFSRTYGHFWDSDNRRQKCWDILLKWGNFGQQKNPHPSPVPSIQSWGVCCFLLVARTRAQHCTEGMGEESYISSFWS